MTARSPRTARPRPTLLGGLAQGTALAAFALAFLFETVALAVVGVALLAMTRAARTIPDTRTVHLSRRHPRGTRVGERTELVVEAVSPQPLPLTVHERLPTAIVPKTETHQAGRGAARHTVTFRPSAPGTIHLDGVTLGLQDRWALHARTVERAFPDRLPVAPEPAWAARGRGIGQRHTVKEVRRDPRGLEPQVEVETVRPYRPGDRVRDIDWRRTALHDTPFTKERERAAPREVVVLLDATASMRAERRIAKLRTATRIAVGVAAAAEGAGVQALLVAFDEDRVVQGAQAQHAGRVRETVARLGSLRGAEPVPARVEPPAPEHDPRRRTRQLMALRAERTRRTVPPRQSRIDAALERIGKLASRRALVVAILDAEVQPGKAEVVVERLRRRGHDVVVVAPATGAHHYRRSEAKGQVLADLVEAQRRRARLTRVLGARGVPLVVAAPDAETAVLQEVAEWIG